MYRWSSITDVIDQTNRPYVASSNSAFMDQLEFPYLAHYVSYTNTYLEGFVFNDLLKLIPEPFFPTFIFPLKLYWIPPHGPSPFLALIPMHFI